MAVQKIFGCLSNIDSSKPSDVETRIYRDEQNVFIFICDNDRECYQYTMKAYSHIYDFSQTELKSKSGKKFDAFFKHLLSKSETCWMERLPLENKNHKIVPNWERIAKV